MEKKDPIEEARRYVANAEEVIKKANYDPELNIYTDGKYVKMAGNTLWHRREICENGGKHPVERLLGGHGCRVWHP